MEERREIKWNLIWNDFLTKYLAPYHELMVDKKTHNTFDEIMRGSIGAGSLICEQIAAHSPQLSRGKKGAQRVIRLAGGESTKRSEPDAEHLTAQLRRTAAEYLGQASEEEIWIIADGSDLRKPYASEMAYWMQVKDLDGKGLVPGYRTQSATGDHARTTGHSLSPSLKSPGPGFCQRASRSATGIRGGEPSPCPVQRVAVTT